MKIEWDEEFAQWIVVDDNGNSVARFKTRVEAIAALHIGELE